MAAYNSLRVPHIQTLFRKINASPNWSIGTYMDDDENPDWITKAEDNGPGFDQAMSIIPIYYFTRFGAAFPMEEMFLTPEDASLHDGLPAELMVRLRDDAFDGDYARFAAKKDIVRTRAWNDVHKSALDQFQEELCVEHPEFFDDDGELIGLKSDEDETDVEIEEDETHEEENDEQESKDRDEVSLINGEDSSAVENFARLSTENKAERSPKPRTDSLIHNDGPGIESTAKAKEFPQGMKRKAAEVDEEEDPDPIRGRVPRRSKRSRTILTGDDDEQEDASYVPDVSAARRQKVSQQNSTPTSSQPNPDKKSKKKTQRAGAVKKEDRPPFAWVTKHRLCCAIAKKHFGLGWTSLESVFSHIWEDDVEKSRQVAGDSKWVKNISTQWRECKREKSQHHWKPVKDEMEAEVPSTEYKAALAEVENAMSELGIESKLKEGEFEELDWEVTAFK